MRPEDLDKGRWWALRTLRLHFSFICLLRDTEWAHSVSLSEPINISWVPRRNTKWAPPGPVASIVCLQSCWRRSLAASLGPVGSLRHNSHIPIQLTCNPREGTDCRALCGRSGALNRLGTSKHRCYKMCCSHVVRRDTSSLSSPPAPEPPFIVTMATRGGVGRCSAHAQCDRPRGTAFGRVSMTF